MNILITGGRGQLGRELSAMLGAGYSELGALPACYSAANVVSVDMDELDICDAEAVCTFVADGGFDVILNCAAMTNVDACETDPETAYRVNAAGVRNLAAAAQRAGCKLVHVSTDYVFAGDSSAPYCEWDIPAPHTVYGKSKLLGEAFLREQCSRYFLVRTAWLYGREGKNFVKTILNLARQNGAITVVDDQRGNPTNAADLAFHLLKLAATEEYGVYHCTGNGVCSWYEFACEIVRLAGIPCEKTPCTTDDSARPARRPKHSALDNLALRCSVGDEMRPWQDALADFLKNCDKGGN